MKAFIVLLLVLSAGCQTDPDPAMLRTEILELHRKLIDAHWNKDVDFFVRDISDDYLSVSYGDITKPTIEEIRAQFTDYINSTTFTQYEDLCDPIIGISKDGSLAWSVVQVKIAGRRTMDDGTERELDFTCAWLSLYERQGTEWIRSTDVSTFK